MIAQHSEIRLYSAGVSTWLAVARYRNVKTPVDAIPIVRIRAPDPKDGSAAPVAPPSSVVSGPGSVGGADAASGDADPRAGAIRPRAQAASSRETASAPARSRHGAPRCA